MVDDSKSGWKSSKYSGKEILLPVPSRIWVRICKAGKRAKFVEAVSLGGSTFLFDVEAFCESEGIQLSKEERRIWSCVVKDAEKYFKPRIVK